jgi:hypothetical protein
VVISISASLLSSYYDAKYNIGGSSTAVSGVAAAAAALVPTPPWQSTSTAPQQSALVSSVMNGAAFFNPNATQLTAPGGTEASDYKNLFALYQGVNALQGLATQAGATGATATQQAAYAAAFNTGMTQLSTFLGQTSFKQLDVNEGTVTASDQTKTGAPEETDTYNTGTVFSGTTSTPVPALAGDVQFSMNLTNTKGVAKTVNFDLSQMGSTPRTMANVVNYLNSQLKAAGAATTFKVVETPAPPQTTTVNGQTVTLSTPPDNLSLQIVGTPTEKVSFSAPATTPAVYITAASGTPAETATTSTSTTSSTPAPTPSDQTQQLMKFNTGDPTASTSQVINNAMQSAVSSALASATAPDGSVYVLTNIDATTADGQTVNGTQDVALMKYDSAGNLMYTRTLGAADSATGYSIAVSADGSDVAIAGSVTGALDGADPGESSTSTSSFVTEYDAAGDEQWTNTQASSSGDVAAGVAFGSNGSVYVTGTTQSHLSGSAGEIGGQDGYLRSYSAAGALTSTTQFGTTGTDTPAGIAVSGSSIYVAGTENGNAVVRQFNIQASGAPTAGTVRNLGAVQGNVVGVGVTADGSVVVGGSTQNGSLSGANVTNAYQGGREGFIATLSPDLQPSSTDSISYVPTTGNLTASAMTVSGNQAYLTGQVATPPPPGSSTLNPDGTTAPPFSKGYVAAVDTISGAVTWSQQFTGTDGREAPTSIAVSSTGASVLDALGLPTTVNYAQPTTLVASSSVRAGDSFYVQNGSGTPQQITIQSADTVQTLATEIQRASGFNVTVTTPTVNGQTVLKIVPNTGANVKLLPGPEGGDALAGLGLPSGELTNDVNQVSTAVRQAKVTLGLNLSTGMNLDSTASIKAAQTALNLASAKIQNAFLTLTTPFSATKSTPTSTSSGTPSQYVENQIANYQSALSWLQNNEGTSSVDSILF